MKDLILSIAALALGLYQAYLIIYWLSGTSPYTVHQVFAPLGIPLITLLCVFLSYALFASIAILTDPPKGN